MTDKLVSSVDDGIGRIVFNDPERLNAVSLEMWQALPALLAAFQADPNVRVCVLSGAGDRAFISGANLGDVGRRRSNAEARERMTEYTARAWNALASFEKPLLAKVRGFCLGAGVGVATHADLRTASADARFGIPAARIGLAYPVELLRSLVTVVGAVAAKRLLFTGGQISAEEALQIGLVDEVVPTAALDERVDEQASLIAGNAPLTIRQAKLAIDQIAAGREDGAFIQTLTRNCLESEDHAEGLLAFQERRKPRFLGR